MYLFVPMSVEYAEEIAYKWKYKEPYSFYNMTENEEDLQQFLNQETWEDSVYAVLDEQKQLVGFFQYNIQNSELVIELGLKPELTGMGLGEKFIQSGLTFGISKFRDMTDSIALTAASFNKGAIKIYQKLGFKIVKRDFVYTNNSNYEFLIMNKSMPVDESSLDNEKFIKDWEKKRKKGKVIYLLTETIFFIFGIIITFTIMVLLFVIYQILFKSMEILVLLEISKDVFNRLNVMSFLPFLGVLSSTIIGTFLNWHVNEKRYTEFLIEKGENK